MSGNSGPRSLASSSIFQRPWLAQSAAAKNSVPLETFRLSEQDVPKPKPEVSFDFTNSRGQMMVIQAIRLGFLLVILAVTLTIQAVQPEFVNTEVLLPVFGLLSVAFLLNSIYLTFFDEALRA